MQPLFYKKYISEHLPPFAEQFEGGRASSNERAEKSRKLYQIQQQRTPHRRRRARKGEPEPVGPGDRTSEGASDGGFAGPRALFELSEGGPRPWRSDRVTIRGSGARANPEGFEGPERPKGAEPAKRRSEQEKGGAHSDPSE